MNNLEYKFRLKKVQSLMNKKDKAWRKMPNYSGTAWQDHTTNYNVSSGKMSDLDDYDKKMIKKLEIFKAAGYDINKIVHKDIIGKVKVSDNELYKGLIDYVGPDQSVVEEENKVL